MSELHIGPDGQLHSVLDAGETSSYAQELAQVQLRLATAEGEERDELLVHQGHRRAGVATELVRMATRWADNQDKAGLFLHVKPDNQAARGLYEQEGFQYTGEVKDDGSLWMLRPWGDGHVILPGNDPDG